MTPTLRQRLLRTADGHGDRVALWVGGDTHTYRELFGQAERVAGAIDRTEAPLCLIYCGTGLARYRAIIACALAGRAFVPVCTTSPLPYLERILDALPGQLAAVIDSGDPERDAALRRMIGERGTEVTGADGPPLVGEPRLPGDTAYVMFTSGSTGAPKAVGVTEANLLAYLDGASELFQPGPADRFAHINNPTFDLSVHDFMLPWTTGGSVWALDQSVFRVPQLIRQHELTFWLSVPTTGLTLADLGLLTPGSLPSLRVSLFCGEPLPRRLAARWQAAAPQGQLYNVYGPTECTIAVTAFPWRDAAAMPEVVPIGDPYPRQRVCVVDDQLRTVPPGEVGELCLQGSQLVPGYRGNPAQTALRFVDLPDQPGRWYRTGDRVSQDPTWGLVFLGRLDDQLQVRGHRVERLEVETAIGALIDTDAVAVLGWPVVEGNLVQGLVAFVDSGLPVAQIRKRITTSLPEYQWPSRVYVGPLPQTRSAKTDYQALRRRLGDQP